jgi:hypothetical protein
VIRTLGERPSIFIRDKPIFSSERGLHKDYGHKGSVEKRTSLVMSFKLKVTLILARVLTVLVWKQVQIPPLYTCELQMTKREPSAWVYNWATLFQAI